MSAEGYISTTDAADRLGITRQRVLQLIEAGRLPASLFANVYMIRESDLKLVEGRVPGRPPKPSSTEKTATAKLRASNGASTGKKKASKR
jgi:excisionase family DNA binding protein